MHTDTWNNWISSWIWEENWTIREVLFQMIPSSFEDQNKSIRLQKYEYNQPLQQLWTVAFVGIYFTHRTETIVMKRIIFTVNHYVIWNPIIPNAFFEVVLYGLHSFRGLFSSSCIVPRKTLPYIFVADIRLPRNQIFNECFFSLFPMRTDFMGYDGGSYYRWCGAWRS